MINGKDLCWETMFDLKTIKKAIRYPLTFVSFDTK